MKLLCVGDIHLGRQPSRISVEVLEQLGGSIPGPATAWHRTVEYAVAHRVDGVLLAGDVVEQEDDFYEAYRDLRHGVQRLAEAGIPVLGVAGNHDVKVLPRLAAAVHGFRLLGRGGQWESGILEAADGARVGVLGWSFAEPVVRTSPLAAGLPGHDEAITTIGLLHCDRDRTDSPHAPVRGAELDAAPVDAWLLGHIHKPDPLSGPRPVGYLGSLTALDPGEEGARGPWVLAIRQDGGLSIDQVALAPLRWETLEIDVEGLDEAGDVHHRVTEAMGRLHEALAGSAHRPEAVGCRLRFTGRTDMRAGLERVLLADDPRHSPHEREGIVYFVHDWRLDVLPDIDLEELARGTDPAGLLARKLLLLRGRDCEARGALIEAARGRLADIPAGRHYSALGAEPPDADRTAAILEAAALQALDALLAQRETAR